MTVEAVSRTDVYARVTARIVEDLERGVRPWHKPWSGGSGTRPLRQSGEPYRGINVLMLWASAEDQGFGCPYWFTFRQAQEHGGHVRKGQKGTPVVYSSKFAKEGDDGSEREVWFLKQYTVFNAEQVEGLPARFYECGRHTDGPPVERADRFFAATRADVRHGGDRAFYSPAGDFVQMPPPRCFRDAESYAATLAHELTHWTKHPTRLDRDTGRKQWGDEGYAMEELVAELGAAFLCADLAVTPEVRADHAAYVGGWLKVLKRDKRAVFTAAAMAQRAVDYLHALQPEHPPEPVTDGSTS